MSLFSIDWSELSLQVMITFGHFLWQACVVGFVLLVAQRVGESLRDSHVSRRRRSTNRGVSLGETDRRRANTRYAIACLAFFALPVCVVGTFAWVHQTRGPILLAASPPVESPATVVASANEPALPLRSAEVAILPPLKSPAEAALPANVEMPVIEPAEEPGLATSGATLTERTQWFAPFGACRE